MYRFVFGNVALRVARRLRIGWPRQYRALLDQGTHTVTGQDAALTYTPAADTTPNAFTFTDQTGVATSTVVTSAAITISGLSVGTSITLNASGGTIDKNGDANFLGSQLVANGDTVRARVTTSSSGSTAVNCTVAASPSGVQDTFTATTQASSGAIVDDQLYSFTTPSARTNTASEEWLGGKTGKIESGTLGARFNDPAWSYPSAQPKYDNAQVLCGTRSLGFDSRYDKATNPGNSGAFGMALDMGAGISEYMAEGYFFIAINPSPNLLSIQLKFDRGMFTSSIVDGNTCLYSALWGFPPTVSVPDDGDFMAYPTGGLIERGDGAGYTNGTNFFGSSGSFQHSERFPNSYPAHNTGIWYKRRLWVKPSTGTNTSDGQWTMDIWRVDTGAQIMANYDINARMYPNANRISHYALQMYHGNASPQAVPDGSANNTTTFETPADGRAYWGDLCLRYGPNCREQIVLGDAATYAACNKALLTHQPTTAWVGNACTIRVNKGPHANLSSKYLYMLNSSGVVVNSSGQPLV